MDEGHSDPPITVSRGSRGLWGQPPPSPWCSPALGHTEVQAGSTSSYTGQSGNRVWRGLEPSPKPQLHNLEAVVTSAPHPSWSHSSSPPLLPSLLTATLLSTDTQTLAPDDRGRGAGLAALTCQDPAKAPCATWGNRWHGATQQVNTAQLGQSRALKPASQGQRPALGGSQAGPNTRPLLPEQ